MLCKEGADEAGPWDACECTRAVAGGETSPLVARGADGDQEAQEAGPALGPTGLPTTARVDETSGALAVDGNAVAEHALPMARCTTDGCCPMDAALEARFASVRVLSTLGCSCLALLVSCGRPGGPNFGGGGNACGNGCGIADVCFDTAFLHCSLPAAAFPVLVLSQPGRAFGAALG